MISQILIKVKNKDIPIKTWRILLCFGDIIVDLIRKKMHDK